jgi:D-ornithine/D-lysine decarboxylase
VKIQPRYNLPSHLDTISGCLAIEGHDLVALAEEHESPLFVFSETRLATNARNFLVAALRGHSRSSVFFASKACSNLHVLKVIRNEGLGVTVSSGGELWKARAVGFAPHEITFNGVSKTHSELRDAIGLGIRAINVESAFELERIADISSNLGKRTTVAFRVLPAVAGDLATGIEVDGANGKFGMTEPELRAAIMIAVNRPQSLDLAGIHVNVGSQIADVAEFVAGVKCVSDLSHEISARLGRPLRHYNLGGGYPVDYTHLKLQSGQDDLAELQATTHTQAAPMVEQVATSAARELGTEAEIHFEPGRSLVADAALLISRIENARKRDGANWLYLDAGYNLLIDSAICRWYYQMLNANRMNAETDMAFRVAGPLCDSADCFFDVEGEHLWKSISGRLKGLSPQTLADLRREIVRLPETRNLPEATAPGDYIAFLDTGAYALGEIFPYCGRRRVKAIMINADCSITVLRERDRYEDLIDRAEFSIAGIMPSKRFGRAVEYESDVH